MPPDEVSAAPPRSFRPSAEPFEAQEFAASWAKPVWLVDLVLASADRIGASVARRRGLGWLALALLGASLVFALPYGFVLGTTAWWRVATLYLGSTLICLPSLYVFTSYLGQRVALSQIVVLGLTVPAVASAFTLGYAPILGFLRATMDADSGQISWRAVSVALLSSALVAGVAQLWRCLWTSRTLGGAHVFVLVLVGWHLVFGYVLLRMASVLGLDR
jgi:hypothetical protein